jgi:hypothetical protein
MTGPVAGSRAETVHKRNERQPRSIKEETFTLRTCPLLLQAGRQLFKGARSKPNSAAYVINLNLLYTC